MILSENEFRDQVQNAYQHLYDLAYLGSTHSPILDMLIPDANLSAREKAWRLHHLLLDAIEQLAPGLGASLSSPEWRRYRLMMLRYVNGMDVAEVTEELNFSRRQFFRDQEAAIEAIANLLWQEYARPSTRADPRADLTDEEIFSSSRLELLRQEAAHLTQGPQLESLDEVVAKAVQIVQQIGECKNIRITYRQADLPHTKVDKSLLRQVFLGLLSNLLGTMTGGQIEVKAQEERHSVRLTLRIVEVDGTSKSQDENAVLERIADLVELAAMLQGSIHVIMTDQMLGGFELEIAKFPAHTVLIVDDNEDVLELYERYLVLGGYQVLKAQTSAEAIRLASEQNPYAITLDLMMPEQDGWDLLQILKTQPSTQHIPVLICSVLNARELALSLGATAFLEKPVTPQDLLSGLGALAQD